MIAGAPEIPQYDWTAEPPEWMESAPGPDERTGVVGIGLPADFWASRRELEHIRQAAWSAGVSTDLVLGAVLAKLSAYISHEMRFDSGAGAPDGGASLNHFVAAVGAPGAGKSEGAAVAQRLLLPPRRFQTDPTLIADGVPLGSGEGLAEIFMGTVKVDDPDGGVDSKGLPKQITVRAQVRHNAFILVDEGQTLATLASRKGSTVGSTLRSAWNAELLGAQNASAENTRIVQRRSYALGMVIGFQPSTAIPLLEDASTGFPQRFHWVSAQLPFPRNRAHWPGHLEVDLEGKSWGIADEKTGVLLSGLMTFPQSVSDELWARKCDIAEGLLEIDQMNTHEPLMRAKMASLLAVLAGREDVEEEDWQLSGVMWETSCRVRDQIRALAEEVAKEEARRKREAAASTAVAVADALADKKSSAVERIAGLIERLVSAHQAEYVATGGSRAEFRGISKSAISRQLNSRDRASFDEALNYAADMQWVKPWANDPRRFEPGEIDPRR